MKKVKLGPRTLIYPLPAVLIGCTFDKRPNFMTASWCCIACSEPAAVAVSIKKTRFTLKGIEERGAFSVNVPSTKLVREVDACGLYSGRDKDKARLFDVFYGDLRAAPLVRECPINHECKVVHLLDVGSHKLVVGEIVETYMTEDCQVQGEPDAEKIDPMIYLTSVRQYARLGDVLAKAYKVGKGTI